MNKNFQEKNHDSEKDKKNPAVKETHLQKIERLEQEKRDHIRRSRYTGLAKRAAYIFGGIALLYSSVYIAEAFLLFPVASSLTVIGLGMAAFGVKKAIKRIRNPKTDKKNQRKWNRRFSQYKMRNIHKHAVKSTLQHKNKQNSEQKEMLNKKYSFLNGFNGLEGWNNDKVKQEKRLIQQFFEREKLEDEYRLNTTNIGTLEKLKDIEIKRYDDLKALLETAEKTDPKYVSKKQDRFLLEQEALFEDENHNPIAQVEDALEEAIDTLEYNPVYWNIAQKSVDQIRHKRAQEWADYAHDITEKNDEFSHRSHMTELKNDPAEESEHKETFSMDGIPFSEEANEILNSLDDDLKQRFKTKLLSQRP